MIGKIFGRWTVLSRAESPKSPSGRTRPYWACRCACGTEKAIEGGSLMRRLTRSCGCLQRELLRAPRKHGHAKKGHVSKTWVSWNKMLVRCNNPKADKFAYYGGRGIRVCERWDEFANFLADMGERPANRTLDRIEVNGNYEPGNCRWATQKEQTRNTRRAHVIEYLGAKMSLAEAAERSGLKYHLVKDRIRAGWTAERALSA